MNVLISIQNLHKRYGRKAVLKGVNLAIEAGEVMALLGANGAGKTTLMRVVTGLTKPDRGEVKLGGASYHQAGNELRRYIGLVGHRPLLYDQLSGWENLHFFARLYDMQQPEVRIEEVLKAVGLWNRRHGIVRTYSRGMTQRLALARAILHDPPVLLLDEPDTGLDLDSAGMLAELIERLGASNRAILLATHNFDRTIEWADSVSLLVNGTIVHQQSTAGMSSVGLRQLYADAG